MPCGNVRAACATTLHACMAGCDYPLGPLDRPIRTHARTHACLAAQAKSRPIMEAARARLAADKGAAALEAFNMGYMLAGDTEKALDPFFPFADAVDVWARTFAALGIHYKVRACMHACVYYCA